MRVSSYEQYHGVQKNLSKIQGQMATQQAQMATGVKYQRPSDSPVDSKQLEVIKHSVEKIEQYKKNVDDATGILATVETSLSAGYGILDTVNQTALQAMNDTYTESDLKALAKVVDSSIQQMVSVGNTKHLGKYVFSGEKYTQEAFAYDGNTITYEGSQNKVDFNITPYISTTVIKGGDYVLQKTIEDMIGIRDAILSGDKALLSDTLVAHKSNMDNISNYQAEVGVDIKSLETSMEGFHEQTMNLEQRRSMVEDVDYVELMVDYSATQRMYEGSLKATAMMFQTSILNYM